MFLDAASHFLFCVTYGYCLCLFFSFRSKRVVLACESLEVYVDSIALLGKDLLPLKTFNFLQFLARIVTHGIYLILCCFNKCFKTIGFF